MARNFRIVFAGTPEFAAVSLNVLATSSHAVCLVLTRPDKPAGRGRRVTPGPVHVLADELGIPVVQPSSLVDAEIAGHLRSVTPDILVVVAYGLILPPEILSIPNFGCINVHASLLPRWRGASPIVHTILAGDEKTGVSIMKMDQGLDTGPVYQAREIPILPGDTAGTLHDRLAGLGADTLIDVLDQLSRNPVSPKAQAEQGATYAPRLQKSDARLDWSRPAVDLERQVRALNPWPVAETRAGDRQLRIWAADAVEASGTDKPGTILAAGKDGIDVATGKGVLRLKRLQLSGRRPLDVGDFLNAGPDLGLQLM